MALESNPPLRATPIGTSDRTISSLTLSNSVRMVETGSLSSSGASSILQYRDSLKDHGRVEIVSVVPGESLRIPLIIVIGSGTSFVFTDYLSRLLRFLDFAKRLIPRTRP